MRFFFFQAEDGIRDLTVTGVQTCALPILGIDADGVAAKAQRRLSRRRSDLDRVGSLVGHVAVDAGSDHARTDLGRHRMLAGLMTCEAFARERSQVSLRSMDVVARGAGHRCAGAKALAAPQESDRSEEHTSELQSQSNLVCRLLLEKKKYLETA